MLGLTLMELLTTLAIAAILVGLAVPSFTALITDNSLRTQINALTVALQFARSEAVKRNRTVSLCHSSNASSCGGTAKNWDAGWIVFANADNDSPAAVDTGEEIVWVGSAIASGYGLRSSDAYGTEVSFDSRGEPQAVGRFVLCKGTDKTRARALFINATGRARLGSDANDNGIPEDDDGNDITTCTP